MGCSSNQYILTEEKIFNNNEMIIKYKIEDEESIKIFGEEFVTNNKDFCKIIIYGKESELCSEIEQKLIMINKEKTFVIKLIDINEIIYFLIS
jgi:hypothetical protein